MYESNKTNYIVIALCVVMIIINIALQLTGLMIIPGLSFNEVFIIVSNAEKYIPFLILLGVVIIINAGFFIHHIKAFDGFSYRFQNDFLLDKSYIITSLISFILILAMDAIYLRTMATLVFIIAITFLIIHMNHQ